MYVCICNALSEAAVREKARAGARSVRQLCEALGVRPQCGKCLAALREMVRDYNAAAAGAD